MDTARESEMLSLWALLAVPMSGFRVRSCSGSEPPTLALRSGAKRRFRVPASGLSERLQL
jgi:hypothetical protein